MLHEEVNRLPERLRTPLVLCYLEGLTYERAAQRLALWTERSGAGSRRHVIDCDGD